jgi:phospholipid transport system substrate-binding protein
MEAFPSRGGEVNPLTVLVTTAALVAPLQVFAQTPQQLLEQQRAAAPANAQPAQDPAEVVTAAAHSMLKELDADRDSYRKNPSKVNDLVEKYLLPHFDTELAAQRVLGAHWRSATPEQRKRFVDAFYHFLLNSYGSALVGFTSDRLQILPVKADPKADRATVRTWVKRNNGDRIAVNYQMLRVNNEWKAWDVDIEGISYVKSYHDDFEAQIDQQGLDSVIAHLEKGEKPSQVRRATSGGKS